MKDKLQTTKNKRFICFICFLCLLYFVLCPLFCLPARAQGNYDPLSLWEQASIYRDEWGVPHVFGDNYVALSFAFGYAQAEDHLEAMLMAYRVANGRAAEVGGEAYAQSDEFSIKMGHATLARAAIANADPLTRDLCEGFAMGVNTWLVEHSDRAPAWAEGVKPADILALMHCYLMSMAPFDLANTFHRAPGAFTGNAWAVGPSRSETGETILAINPHTAYDGPFQWYEAHLVCQDLNMAGATLFGLPVIIEGHNDVLGWALSPNNPDFADIYLEPAIGAEEKKQETKTTLQRMLQMLMLSSAQPYYVATPQGPVQRAVPYVDTAQGPVVGSLRGLFCAWRIGGYRDFGALAQLVEMGRARDLGTFQRSLGMHQLPCFHIVYADRAGNISYLYNVKVGNKAGFIPTQRKKPVDPDAEPEELAETAAEALPAVIDWRQPVPADKGLFQWGAVIPVGALPSVTNPDSGYVQACGTPPWGVTDNSGIKPESLPRWLAQDRDTYRAQRVRRLLAMGKRSFRDCQAMLYDVVSPFAMEMVPKLAQLAEKRSDFVKSAHPDLEAGIDTLKTWNFAAENNSTGMTFFHAWWTALHAQNLGALKREDDLYAALRANDPAIQDAELAAAADAARLMRNDFQSVTVPWGEVHTIRRGAKEVSLAGAATGEPIFVESDFVYDARKWRATYGYGFAMVVAFGDKPSAVSMVPFGASENPASPHYADQLDLMAERRFKVTRFQPEDVQRYASSARGRVLYLRPKGMEALVTLHAQIPIEARLTSSAESDAKPPEGLAPFTLFFEIEKAPSGAPVEIQIQIFVPQVLCARENLKELGIYACDKQQKWTRLDEQQLDEESRTFSAHDAGAFSTFAVLGPEKFRAERLVVPGAESVQANGGAPLFPTPGLALPPAVPMPPRPPQAEKPAEPLKKPVIITNVEQENAPKPEQASELIKKPVLITNVPQGAESGQPATPGKKPIIITNVPDDQDSTPSPGQKKKSLEKLNGVPPAHKHVDIAIPDLPNLKKGEDSPEQIDLSQPTPENPKPRATMDGQPLPEIQVVPPDEHKDTKKSKDNAKAQAKAAKKQREKLEKMLKKQRKEAEEAQRKSHDKKRDKSKAN